MSAKKPKQSNKNNEASINSDNHSIASIPMFSGDLTFMECPRIDLQKNTTLYNSIVVMGIPFDTATSNRPGTRLGPRAIRIASKMLSWQRMYGWKEDLYQVETSSKKIKVFDGGDLNFDFGKQPSIIYAIKKGINSIIQKKAKPLILGGDHFISYPILSSLKDFYFADKDSPIALVQFDAHSDTWEDEPNRIDHGTGFFHAVKEKIVDPKHSIQIGIRTCNDNNLGIEVIDGFATHRMSSKAIASKIIKRVGNKPAYFTFDIDCFDPAYAPGTGTPVVGGLIPTQVLAILKELTSINWIGGDVVEVSPPFDHGEVTALAGATVAGYLGHLLNSSNYKR